MSARLLLLCPGQGGQHQAMFDLARTSASAAALLDSWSGQLPTPALDDATMLANRSAQPLIVAATLAMWSAIRDFTPQPDLVAGYSIGELTAYAIAGALTPTAAVELASLRAGLMNASLATHPGQALLAISGLPLKRVTPLLQANAYHLSIETGDDSCVSGGPASALAQLELAVEAAGGRSRRLPVEVASHTPYMQQAVAPFAAALRERAFATLTTPVLAGVDASTVTRSDQAIPLLSRQLAEPIRWLACMDACAEAGISVALELGPGGALARMLQARQPHIQCRSVADFRTLDGIRRWLERALEQ
ncbi:MAG: ACP S-malonyltransferase [Sphingomonadaceae bacterium]